MGVKTKYTLVRLASVISGTTRVWGRDKLAPKSAVILFDPAIGKNVLFREIDTIKGKAKFPANVMKKFNITE